MKATKKNGAPEAPDASPPPLPPSPEPPAAAASDAPTVPDVLPVLPLREHVLFPDMLLPLTVSGERDTLLVDQTLLQSRMVAFVPVEEEAGESADGEPTLHGIGTAGLILKMMKLPDNSMRLLVQGLKRLRVETYLQRKPYLAARVAVVPEVAEPGVALDALHRSVRDQFSRLLSLLPQTPEEMRVSALNITQPGRFADLVAANLNLSLAERCSILDAADVKTRLERVSVLLERETQIVELGSKIHEDVKSKINKGQREFFLREQMRAIRQELGEDNDRVELNELEEALDAAKLPEEADKEARRELARLQRMAPGSAEYTVARTYLDWMVALPWNKVSTDKLDPVKARRRLDRDHYDLDKIKERIVEFLAVRRLHPEGRSPILCFVGPPGVGKTSLGRSIAAAMRRAFWRISLGGVRDEAEIRGHRRTYVGALPGRIVQGLRRAGTKNPVFMLDEIDKLASDYRGDPSSALLEVLDPEQNHRFSDHYLDVTFDLSQVIFIATANEIDPIPPALRDRLEILPLAGYALEEKLAIARRHLVPRVLADHGLKKTQMILPADTMKEVVERYTHEAGLRNFSRELANIARKIAVKVASGKRGPFTVRPGDLKTYLGPPRFFGEDAGEAERPGVSVGLSWSSAGGDILFIETARLPGPKNLQLTGRLGDVIKESAQAAWSWIRGQAEGWGIDDEYFASGEVHVHFPEGAVPKDGPSAGLALVVALASLVTGVPVRRRLAMTGEITLRGKVLPVGGVKEKVLAARRAGVKDVLLPRENMPDLEELPPAVKKSLRFHPVDRIEDALPVAFPAAAFLKAKATTPARAAVKKATKKAAKKKPRSR